MTATEAEATDEARLAARLAVVIETARAAGNGQMLADLEELPRLVEEADREEQVARARYTRIDAILTRLADAGVSQSIVGHAAGRSKSFVGTRLAALRTPAAKRKHR